MTESGHQALKIECLIYDTPPFHKKFMMKSEGTLDWCPASENNP